MTLTPIRKRAVEPRLTPIFKSADPEFNHRAARAAYEMVMKMSEDEARVFTEIVVADAVEEIIEKNLRTVQRHLDEVISKRTEDFKKALIRKAAQDPEGVLPYAQALAVIEKAKNPYDYGYRFQETDFRRDPQTGRFQTKVTHTQKKPINSRTAAAIGIPEPPPNVRPERKAQYQDEYRQVAQFLGAVHESAAEPGSVKVALTYEDATGRRSTDVIEGTQVPKTKLGQDERLIGIQANPGALTAGGAAFGLTHAIGRKGVESINNMNGQNARDFARDWTRETDGRNTNERTYNRIAAGSKYLGQVAPYSEKAQMASAFGDFVGNMGPEAEKVIGPTARKTAYRYRGTEKTPDKKLVNAYASAINRAKASTANDPYRNTPEGRRANLKSPSTLAPHQMARARAKSEGRAPTWEERELGRRAILEYFKGNPEKGERGKIPSRDLYALQLASGNTPPSEGVMLNKDGQIVTQAVGYGDDHYLPFDLKNLKHLKGGEYIRTRSVGGLTSEDIYTGLISGARQVTVVSRSGTFTLTFDEDLRGGRRHNDKARRMTRRYEQILDAVQSEKVDRGQVRQEIQEIITNQVHQEMDGYASARDIRSTIRQRIEEYKEDPELAPEDEILIDAMARASLRDGATRDEKEFKRQITGKILADKQTRYRLDGHGYEAALKALEEQFPYYITVKSKPEDSADIQNLELDRGYVEPGLNRPTAAAAGLFGAKHGIPASYKEQGKVSASDTDYQRFRSNKKSPDSAEGETKDKDAAPKKTGEKAVKAEKMAQYVPAVAAMQSLILGYGEESFKNPEMLKTLRYTPEEIAADPIKQRKFDAVVNEVERSLKSSGRSVDEELGITLTQYRSVSGDLSRVDWDPTKAGLAGALPFAFEGAAYEGKSEALRQGEIKRVAGMMPTSIASTKRLEEMSDAELRDEVTRLVRVKEHLSVANIKDETPDSRAARIQALKNIAPNPDSPSLKRLLSNAKLVDTYLESVHRMRALKHGANAQGAPVTHTTPQEADRRQQQSLREAKGSEYEIALLRYAAGRVRERKDDKSQDRADGVEHIANQLEQAKSAAEYDVLREDARTVIEGADRIYRGDFLPIWQQTPRQVNRGGSSLLDYGNGS